MSLFGKVFKSAVNVAILPVTLPLSVAKDVVTLGGIATDQHKTYTEQLVQRIKDEADE
jgi:hypothetical protein